MDNNSIWDNNSICKTCDRYFCYDHPCVIDNKNDKPILYPSPRRKDPCTWYNKKRPTVEVTLEQQMLESTDQLTNIDKNKDNLL